MIKRIGSIGFYIKFNESASSGLKFFEVFSSSALTTSLFSASTNSVQDVGRFGNSSSYYLNGYSASTTYSNEWQQMVFTFNPKLETTSDNNFVVRLGNTEKANFNIQNVFILDKTLYDIEVLYIYNDFTSNLKVINAGDNTSKSMTLIDRNERLHTSSFTGLIYQPLDNQTKFRFDIQAVATGSVTSPVTTNNATYDGYDLIPNDYILSLSNNTLYQVQSDSTISTIATSNGDYFNVINGMRYGSKVFVKVSGVFIEAPKLNKIESSVVTDLIE